MPSEVKGAWEGVRPRASRIPLGWATTRPDLVAFYAEGGVVTYHAFGRAIREAEIVLAASGIAPGDRVAIVGVNSVETAAFLFAAQELDAWPALLNARLSAREIDECTRFSGAKLSVFAVQDAPEAAAHAERSGARPVDSFLPIAIAYHADDAKPEPVRGNAEDIAALIFTSGTTGRPKGVMLSHRVLLAVSDAAERHGTVACDDVLYGVAPFAHVIGLGTVLMTAMTAGAAVELAPRFDPEALAHSIAAGRVTRIVGVPVIYARLVDHIAEHGIDISKHRLRALTCGGAPLDLALKARVEKLFGLPLTNGYGCTECSPIARGEIANGEGPSGEAFHGVEIRLVKDGMDVGAGEIGEIWVRGPFMMSGYYRDPEATAAVMRSGGWLATGDLGRFDEEKRLTIVGRSKELIIRSGFNVYPVEVESVLNAHPLVHQSAVVGRTLSDKNEEVIAFVELANGGTLSAEELQRFAVERLAPYKKPARIVFMRELPLGPTGKVDKLALQRLAQAGIAA